MRSFARRSSWFRRRKHPACGSWCIANRTPPSAPRCCWRRSTPSASKPTAWRCMRCNPGRSTRRSAALRRSVRAIGVASPRLSGPAQESLALRPADSLESLSPPSVPRRWSPTDCSLRRSVRYGVGPTLPASGTLVRWTPAPFVAHCRAFLACRRGGGRPLGVAQLGLGMLLVVALVILLGAVELLRPGESRSRWDRGSGGSSPNALSTRRPRPFARASSRRWRSDIGSRRPILAG